MRFILTLAVVSSVVPLAASAWAQKYRVIVGPSVDNGKIYGVWKRAPHSKGSHTLDNVLINHVSRTCRDDCLEIEDGSGPVTVLGGTWRHVGSPEKISAPFTNQNGNLILEGVTVVGSYDPMVKSKTRFPNTDGVMAAQRTFLTVNGGSFSNFWDAAIDTKATTKLTGTVTLENSGVSLKVWGRTTAENIVSRNPRRGHISCLRSPAVGCDLHIKKLVAYDTNPNGLLVGFQGSNTTVQIDACELHVRATMRVQWAKPGVTGTKLILGPTCANNGKVVVYPVAASQNGR